MGVDGPRGRAAVGGRRLNPVRSWLRLLGIAGEPVSFVTPDPPAAVRLRLAAARDEVLARRWADGGARVALRTKHPFSVDRPRALLRIFPEGAGSQVVGEVGPPLMVRLYGYLLPLFVLLLVQALVAAVGDPRPGTLYQAAVMALVLTSMTVTIVANRRALPMLRDTVDRLLTGAPVTGTPVTGAARTTPTA